MQYSCIPADVDVVIMGPPCDDITQQGAQQACARICPETIATARGANAPDAARGERNARHAGGAIRSQELQRVGRVRPARAARHERCWAGALHPHREHAVLPGASAPADTTKTRVTSACGVGSRKPRGLTTATRLLVPLHAHAALQKRLGDECVPIREVLRRLFNGVFVAARPGERYCVVARLVTSRSWDPTQNRRRVTTATLFCTALGCAH